MKKFKKGSFVAISDFHSYRWPLEKVKDHYLNEYETIYILGDATDRGEYSDGSGGISLLLEIKKLSEQYPGRIVYLPGNHDDFLYQYAKYDDYKAQINLIRNHGSQTIKDIDSLRDYHPKEFLFFCFSISFLPFFYFSCFLFPFYTCIFFRICNQFLFMYVLAHSNESTPHLCSVSHLTHQPHPCVPFLLTNGFGTLYHILLW